MKYFSVFRKTETGALLLMAEFIKAPNKGKAFKEVGRIFPDARLDRVRIYEQRGFARTELSGRGR